MERSWTRSVDATEIHKKGQLNEVVRLEEKEKTAYMKRGDNLRENG